MKCIQCILTPESSNSGGTVTYWTEDGAVNIDYKIQDAKGNWIENPLLEFLGLTISSDGGCGCFAGDIATSELYTLGNYSGTFGTVRTGGIFSNSDLLSEMYNDDMERRRYTKKQSLGIEASGPPGKDVGEDSGLDEQVNDTVPPPFLSGGITPFGGYGDFHAGLSNLSNHWAGSGGQGNSGTGTGARKPTLAKDFLPKPYNVRDTKCKKCIPVAPNPRKPGQGWGYEYHSDHGVRTIWQNIQLPTGEWVPNPEVEELRSVGVNVTANDCSCPSNPGTRSTRPVKNSGGVSGSSSNLTGKGSNNPINFDTISIDTPVKKGGGLTGNLTPWFTPPISVDTSVILHKAPDTKILSKSVYDSRAPYKYDPSVKTAKVTVSNILKGLGTRKDTTVFQGSFSDRYSIFSNNAYPIEPIDNSKQGRNRQEWENAFSKLGGLNLTLPSPNNDSPERIFQLFNLLLAALGALKGVSNLNYDSKKLGELDKDNPNFEDPDELSESDAELRAQLQKKYNELTDLYDELEQLMYEVMSNPNYDLPPIYGNSKTFLAELSIRLKALKAYLSNLKELLK